MPSALGLVDNILHCRIPVLFRALIQPLPTTCGTVSMCDCLGVRKISTHRSRRGGRCWLAGANVRLLIQSFSFKSRWQLVVNALTSAPITSSRDLEQAIMLYNTRYKDKYDWSFDGLHHLFEEVLEPEETEAFFGKTMPGMVELLTASPSIITSPLPLLKSGKTHSITLSQQQVHHVWIMFLSQRIFSLCLVWWIVVNNLHKALPLKVAVVLVNAFFCTFPRRNASKPNSEFSNFPMINFNALFIKNTRRMTACLEKLKCLLCYFSQVDTNNSYRTLNTCPVFFIVSITRRAVKKNLQIWDNCPNWWTHPLNVIDWDIYHEFTGTFHQKGDKICHENSYL